VNAVDAFWAARSQAGLEKATPQQKLERCKRDIRENLLPRLQPLIDDLRYVKGGQAYQLRWVEEGNSILLSAADQSFIWLDASDLGIGCWFPEPDNPNLNYFWYQPYPSPIDKLVEEIASHLGRQSSLIYVTLTDGEE
jgi:hypothetical protein